MSLPPWTPLALAALLYVWQAGEYYWTLKNPPYALAFIGYALANVGFIWDIARRI